MRRNIAGGWIQLLLMLGLGQTGCQPSSLLHPADFAQVPSITGQVTDLAGRSAQATIGDVAAGATVSLIDTTTGRTVGTTVTSPSGGFSLSFGHGFNPGPQPYFMEAVKGLPVGGNANRAGASAARVRTLLYYSGGWTSLNSPSPNGPVNIGTATTALCDIVSLRNLPASNLVGSLNGTTFTPPSGSAITQSEYGTVWSLIGSLLAADEDPVEAIGYDSNLPQPYFTKPGDLLIFGNYSVNGVANATASLSAPYNQVVFNGQNFPSTGSISVGPVPAATWSVNAARTQLTVTLSTSGCSGYLQVAEGQSTWTGPFLYVSGTVGTYAGNLPGNLDGQGTMARMTTLHDVIVDAAGNLYLADNSNACVRKIAAGGVVTTLRDNTGAIISFNDPTGLALDGAGNLYVAERSANRIRMVTPAGNVSVLAGSGTSGVVDGPAASAQFKGPFGVAADSVGNVYVTDEYGADVRRISGGNVYTLAGSASVAGGADGTGTAAQFNTPCAVVVDSGNNVYVADLGNSKIRKITPGGVVTSLGSVTSPVGVAVDAAGNVFSISQSNNQLYRIPSGGAPQIIAGTGVTGTLDAPAPSAQFDNDYGVSVDGRGNVYTAERLGYRIRVYTP